MNINYHPAIGVDKLRAKINEVLEGDEPEAPVVKSAVVNKVLQAKKEALKLIRINVSCMNPAKKDWDGEVFTTGNSLTGTIRKFVQFNTTDGYHVPNMIYEMMKAKEYQLFYNEKSKNGVNVRKGKLTKEFVIDVLDPLTPEELKDLAKVQNARGD